MEVELRKNQNTLVIIGTGVIAFAFWTMLKGLYYIKIDNVGFGGIINNSFAELNQDLSSNF